MNYPNSRTVIRDDESECPHCETVAKIKEIIIDVVGGKEVHLRCTKCNYLYGAGMTFDDI